jgi:hypothetical protein
LAEGETVARDVVKISIEVYSAQHEPAAAAFNRRMRDANAPTDFLLGESSVAPRTRGGVTVTQWIAVDGEGQVRGGVLSWDQQGIVGRVVQRVINLQSPLSEGIVDSAYFLVGSQIIKFFLRQTPYVYIVGMGAEDRPLPRVLKAMGWTVCAVPFYFRMIHPARCVRELGPLRTPPWKRIAGTVAAATGAASIGALVLHRATASARNAAAEYAAEEATSWGEWAADAWSAFAPTVRFSVLRDPENLSFYYPFHDDKLKVWRLKRGAAVEGWFALAISKMSANAYFGNLRVATLTDCVGSPNAIRSGCMLAIEEATRLGADLLITNQAYTALQEACLGAGWRRGPSNFILATSKALSKELDPELVYVTRRDGDGLINLLSPG